jgi:nicotinamide-nucleotide amidase
MGSAASPSRVVAEVVSVGDELLAGSTTNTNSGFIARTLLPLGISVRQVTEVGDIELDIQAAVRAAMQRAQVIIITGGLGPTPDDHTKEDVARLFDDELELDASVLEAIRQRFAARGRTMSPINEKQAWMPRTASIIPNPIGSAPGVHWQRDGCEIFLLPGVPIEMKQVFEDYVFGRVESLLEEADERSVVVSRKLKCFGTGESNIAEMLGAIMKRGRNPLINCTVHEAVITLHIVATAPTADKAEEMIEKDMHHLTEILDDTVFGEDEQTMAEVVGQLLCERGLTLAVAESCTGGMIAKMITDIPGASQYFKIGWVTYTNEAKNSELKVDMALIDKHGAVSSQVAEAMALGARLRSRADIGIGVTGIAGPGGENAEKPVGLVYIGLSYADKDGVRIGKDIVLRNVFSHSRGHIRRCSALTALNSVRLTVKN